MDTEVKKLEQLIQNAQRILITSHISPDPDAVSSLLLLGTTLKLNFTGKQIKMVLEEEPTDLNFLEGYKHIAFGPVYESISVFKPDLLILLDGNNYERCSRHDGSKVREYIRQNMVRTIVIDHHESDGKDQVDVFINRDSPATAQMVYEILFNELGFEKPPKTAQTAMTGYYADTGGFVYLKGGKLDKLFDFAEQLVAGGANVEQVKNKLSQYSEANVRALGELAGNTSHEDSYSYSFISDKFMDEWLKTHTLAELQKSTGAFLDEYIRNIGGRQWGFIVYKNLMQGKNFYSVSLRAVSGVKDVAEIASKLGGGGHKPAAGAKFEASSVEEALEKVKSAIKSED